MASTAEGERTVVGCGSTNRHERIHQFAMMGNLPYDRIRDAASPIPALAQSLNNLFSTLD